MLLLGKNLLSLLPPLCTF